MSYFNELDLPQFELYQEFSNLLSSGKINWFGPEYQDQICINSIKKDPDNFLLGRASLFYDWDKSYMDNGKLEVPKRKLPLREAEFTTLCGAFKNTLFEEVYNIINKKYKTGRIRIMNSQPKTCLTWHSDKQKRLHYPMKTQAGCLMVINNEAKHLKKNSWYITDTTVDHTAINASKENRIHMVACILGERNV